MSLSRRKIRASSGWFDRGKRFLNSFLIRPIRYWLHFIIKQLRQICLKKVDFKLTDNVLHSSECWRNSPEDLLAEIDNYDTISFDIFDTLITRPLLIPDTAFEIVNLKIEKDLRIKVPYTRLRKKAEFKVRAGNNFIGDCSIDDIYEVFQKLTRLKKVDSERIKEIEIENEIDLCLPRKDMIESFYYAKSKKKSVFLISDTYLRKQDIERILSKCGVQGWDGLLLSSALNKRKDTGELWDYYKCSLDGSRCLHIGDNGNSDVQLPSSRGLKTYYAPSGMHIFSSTNLGKRVCEGFDEGVRGWDSVVLGTMVSKEFNSPFALHDTGWELTINNLKRMGYVIFGPLFLTFITWLVRNLRKDNVDYILFLAREGYYLKKLYDRFTGCLERKGIPRVKIESAYFLASRRATSVASVSCEEDIQDLLEAPYKGTISYLLASRFGIVAPGSFDGNEVISLPEDYKKVRDVVRCYTNEIMNTARMEREQYLKYSYSLDLLKQKRIGIVDLGYSGTMQYYLSKIFDKPITGYYLVTTSNSLKGERYRGNVMKDCYSFRNKYTDKINPIYAYSLILEGLLTSPEGQLVNFTDEGNELKPVFDKPGQSQRVFDSLNQIFEGVLDFVEDAVEYHGSYLMDLRTTGQTAQSFLEHMVMDNSIISKDLEGFFFVDDKYSSDRDVLVFDLYREHYGIKDQSKTSS